jgi:hypothetical protein
MHSEGNTSKKNAIRGERTKSFDAKQIHNNETTFYFLKYVGAKGGSQDNQIRDLLQMTEYADKYVSYNPSTTYNFVGIIDGVFNVEIIAKAMKRIVNKKKVHIISSSCELHS